jgi:hypothetical protein
MVETPTIGPNHKLRLISTVLLVVIVAAAAALLTSRTRHPEGEPVATQRINEAGSFDDFATEWVPHLLATTNDAVVAAPAKEPPPPVVNAIAVPSAPASAAAAAVVPPANAQRSVADLVAEVEASGLDPGSNWTWSMGDTATHCGVISGAGTGCTYGSGGLEFTIFSGAPTLALVAHEMANAETQNDAVPDLLTQVAIAEAGRSWSPTDAVASCLVEHFMGFQDDAAGVWQCPVVLAAVVAAHIHDTL